jgi:Domain of unknown function (DUF4412)
MTRNKEELVRSKTRSWMAWLFAPFALCFALPAAADITVVTHYTLVNGDTLTRPSYYSARGSRVTAPDGKEFMYNSRGAKLTVIDHTRKMYWTGPLAKADSIADRILLATRKEVAKVAAQDQEAWLAKVQGFNDSIRVVNTGEVRKIAGYPSTRWLLTAGSYMQHERWVARSLAVANYGPEMQKAVMASAMDPLGRQLMKMLIGMRDADGLPLEARTTFRTLTQTGSFSYETVQIITTPIPASAWEIPKDYQAVELKR